VKCNYYHHHHHHHHFAVSFKLNYLKKFSFSQNFWAHVLDRNFILRFRGG
jgi:hypothetical protein